MLLVSIADLKPGQVVAKAVTNASGAVLCPPGFRLTDTSIERLKQAGVDSVILEGVELEGDVLAARIDAFRRRFQGIDDPIMLQLKATIEKRLNFMKLGE